MKKFLLLILQWTLPIYPYRNNTIKRLRYFCKMHKCLLINKVFTLVLTMILFILLPLVACSGSNTNKPADTAVNAEKQPVQAFGIVKALETVEITAPLACRITKIHVKEGQNISSGDTLAEYDAHEAEIQLELMKQELTAIKSKTEARVKMLDEKKKLLNSNKDPELMRMEKSLESAKVKHLMAVEDMSRLEALKNSDTVSEKDYRDSSVISEISLLTLEELQLSLESLKRAKQKEIQLEDLQINQELSETKLLELKIGLIRDKMNNDFFKDNKIISPDSKGIIEKTGCREGAEAAEKSLLFSIINIDTLIIEANVDEQFIRDVHLGARAYIIPESDRSKEYKGIVTFISSIAILQNGETVIAVQITPDDKDVRLHPGSNAEIDILTD